MKRLVSLLLLAAILVPIVDHCLTSRSEACDLRTSWTEIKIIFSGDTNRPCGDGTPPTPPPPPPPPPPFGGLLAELLEWLGVLS